MKNRFLLNLILLAVLLASCAPAAAPTESLVQPAAPVAIEPTATPLTMTEPTAGAPTNVAAQTTEAAAPTPFPVATSRGPNLEATDPTTVNMASGGLQFVEFFRFT